MSNVLIVSDDPAVLRFTNDEADGASLRWEALEDLSR